MIKNEFKYENTPNYTKLKKYWKLILKNSSKLKNGEREYNSYFKKYINQKEMVDYMISLSEELEESYALYQNLISAFETNNINFYNRLVNNINKKILKNMKKAIRTLNKYLNYI